MFHLSIDLPTVLLLQVSSLLAGAMGIFNLRSRSQHHPGLGFLASCFLMLGVGGVIAAMGEADILPYALWTHLTLVMGCAGYALMWLGASELSGGPWRRYQRLVAAIPAGWLVLGLATQFPLANTPRATAFHLNACFFLIWSALIIWRDHHADGLHSRRLLSWMMLSSGAVYGVIGVLMLSHGANELPIAEAFFLQIIFNFCIVLLIMSLVNERTESKLRHATETDELTGVGNRRYLASRLPELAQVGWALAVLDLDHFKRINDYHGHEVGDRVLASSAAALKTELRDCDTLVRLGGEEFAIFLPEVSKEDACAVAERLRFAVAAQKIETGASGRCSVTASIGLVWVNTQGQAWSHWLHLADLACYEAKRRQRDCVVLHER